MPPLRLYAGAFEQWVGGCPPERWEGARFAVGADDLGGPRAVKGRRYGRKRTRDVGLETAGAGAEPHHFLFSSRSGPQWGRMGPHPSAPDPARRRAARRRQDPLGETRTQGPVFPKKRTGHLVEWRKLEGV